MVRWRKCKCISTGIVAAPGEALNTCSFQSLFQEDPNFPQCSIVGEILFNCPLGSFSSLKLLHRLYSLEEWMQFLVSQKGLEGVKPQGLLAVHYGRKEKAGTRAIFITNDTLKQRLIFFFLFWQGHSVLSIAYVLLLLSSYSLPPLLLARCPLFLQTAACGACKSQYGLLLPAEASLDASNPSRSCCFITASFLTPVHFIGEIHVAGWDLVP